MFNKLEKTNAIIASAFCGIFVKCTMLNTNVATVTLIQIKLNIVPNTDL